MEIMAKDFWQHVGKTILMPHPTGLVMPCELKIVKADKKQVTMRRVDTGAEMTANYSKDKRKFRVVQ